MLTDSDTTERRRQDLPLAISDAVDILSDKIMYLLEHNENNVSYPAAALYTVYDILWLWLNIFLSGFKAAQPGM